MQKVTIGLGPLTTVEISSDNIKQIIEQASFWSSLPNECPLCGYPLVFFHRLTKEDDSYWGQACTGTTIHEANFGVYKKEERGFYYKGDWQKAYDAYQNGGGREEDGSANNYTPAQPQSSTDNVVSQAARNFNEAINPQRQAEPTQEREEGFPANPIARSLSDLITARQLGMIRAIAREASIEADQECNVVMRCKTDELSKRGASALIQHLQDIQSGKIKAGSTQGQAPNPERPPLSQHPAAPIPAPAQVAPVTQTPAAGTSSAYDDDDIPF